MGGRLTYKIFSHPSRRNLTEKLASELDISEANLFYDDRDKPGSVLYVAKKAWMSPFDPNATHACVLQEDVEICNGFKDICEQMVEAHPDRIIGLYPFLYPNKSKCPKGFFEQSSPYIEPPTICGVGIIMPIAYIQPCFEWICANLPEDMCDDTAIDQWARKHDKKFLSTIPSIVQHIGDQSIVTPDAEVRRTEFFEKNPVADWSCKDIFVPHYEDFVSKHFVKRNGLYYPKRR